MANPEVGLAKDAFLDDQDDSESGARKQSLPQDAPDIEKTSSRSSGSGLEDAITWEYLEWTTDIRLPDRSTLSSDTNGKLPSTSTFDKYISPFEWSESRKSFITWLSCFATAITAYAAGSYTPGEQQMMAEWHVSRVVVTLGVTTFTTGFGFAPMILAPFSEVNGRRPLFVVTGVLYVLSQLFCAVSRSFPGLLLARFFMGCVSSTFSTMVGGVVSDIYHAHDRNTAMALFSGAALGGTGLGPMVSGFLAANTTWRWIFYLQIITCSIMMAAVVLFFKETRGSVLLSRKAKAINKYYEEIEALGIFGVEVPGSAPDRQQHRTKQRIRYKVKSDEERASIGKLITVSLTRPFHLLFTEPTVFFFSLWVSFAWGILYLTFAAVPLVFENHFGFSLEQSGAVFASMVVAAIISTVISIWGEKLAKRRYPNMNDKPEGRLYFPCIQSILLPIGIFWFGWTSFQGIPWIVPTLAIGCATMGIFSIYLAVFNYLADTYHRYASSALAAQSFCRNLLGGTFPLFSNQMFNGMTYQGASSLLGGFGLLLTLVPFVLLIWGPRIRARSKFASEIMNT